MFMLRDPREEDLDDLCGLAAELNTINLPNDRAAIERTVSLARASFEGRASRDDARYFFVLEDLDAHRVIGTSMIIASHGTPQDPHNYLRVDIEERYSSQLRRVFQHETLTLRQSYTPHTEIGALVLSPAYRGHPLRLGKLLSFVRFLYMAVYRTRFHGMVEAELLPPFREDGSSVLWEWLGRPFTGLSYQEADDASRKNPEFIRELFPSTPIYTSLMPQEVREVIGAVGPKTQGVARMLSDIGFQYDHRIDPFDGGPHYACPIHKIGTIRDTFHTQVSDAPPMTHNPETGLVARLHPGSEARFMAVPTVYERHDGRILLPTSVRETLGLRTGDTIAATPIPLHVKRELIVEPA